MRARGNRRPLYAGLGLAGLLLLGLVVGIYRSGGQKLGTLNRTLRERNDTLARLEGRVATLKKLEARCRMLKARLEVLEPALPTGEYIPTFLRQIEKLAEDTDNHLSGVRPKPVVQVAVTKPQEADDKAMAPAGGQQAKTPSRPPYETLTIEMGMEGGYWDLERFLVELGQFPKMIAVNEMALAGRQQNTGSSVENSGVTTKIDLIALIQNGEQKSWKDGKKS